VRRVYNLDGVTLASVHYALSPVETILGNHNYGTYVTNHLSRYFTYETNGWLSGETWTTNGVACAVLSNRYDNAGNLVWSRDALSNVATFAYNDKRDLVAATNARGDAVSIGYNIDGSIAAATNARGHVTRWLYNAQGFNTNVVFADNTGNAMTHDAIGRVTTFRDAAGDQSSFGYDKLDRVTNILFASDSTRMAYTYSFAGVTNISDRLLRTTSINRDVLGRPVSVADACGNSVAMSYDVMNNISRIHVGMGAYTNTLKFDYASTNGFTRLARTVSAMGRTNNYDYTFRGLPASHTDPRGVVVSNAFDLLSRVVRTSYGAGTNVDFTYDALSRLTGISDAFTTNAFVYDAIGQVTSRTSAITVPGFSNVSFRVDYAFDQAGNLTNRVVTGTGGLTNIVEERRVFDCMNRLTLVSNAFAVATYGFDSAGRLSTKNYGNGDVTAYGYGPESRLASLMTSNAGAAVQGWTFSHNAMGLITNITGTGGVREYEYNAVDRLIAEKFGSTNVTAWTYDSCGNRLAASNAAGIVRSTYNDDNEMTRYSQNTNDWIDVRGTVAPGPRSNKWYNSWAYLQGMSRPVSPVNGQFEFASVPVTSGSNQWTVTVRDVSGNVDTQKVSFTKLNGVGATVTHDAAENLTGVIDGGVTNVYEWDAANRLASATSNGVEVLRCWYDGAGRRIAKSEIVGGQTNRYLYVYEGWTVIAVLNQQGALLEYYTRGRGLGDIGTIVAATHTNGTFYVHSNHRGDVTTVRSGSVTVATYDYTAFGEARSATGNYSSRFRFSSKELDQSTDFYYFGFRYMSPTFGRFISPDPMGLAAGLNRFEFCLSNPVNFIDRAGAMPQWASDALNGYTDSTVGRQFISIGDAFGSGVAGYWGWFTMNDNLMAAAGQLLRESANNSGWAILDEECAGIGARIAYGGALGVSATAAAIAIGHGVIGEIGAKAFSNAQWPGMELQGLSNFEKGMQLIKSQGLLRALLPTATGLKLGIGSGAILEGPTAAAALGGIPAVVTGGRIIYGIWHNTFGN
jgi:RHS repeat-associated protein